MLIKIWKRNREISRKIKPNILHYNNFVSWLTRSSYWRSFHVNHLHTICLQPGILFNLRISTLNSSFFGSMLVSCFNQKGICTTTIIFFHNKWPRFDTQSLTHFKHVIIFFNIIFLENNFNSLLYESDVELCFVSSEG